MVSDLQLSPKGGWAGAADVRLSAPRASEHGLLFRSLSQAAKKFGRREVPEIFSVMHLNPRLFWGWLFFASRLMPGGKLPAQTREKIILRTAWNCRSRYEWGQHVDIALSAGVSDAEIVKLSQGPDAFGGAPDETLLRACDEMCAEQVISDATWATLAADYDAKLLIEITMLIGHYIMVAGFLNSTGLVLEQSVEQKLQDFHARIS